MCGITGFTIANKDFLQHSEYWSDKIINMRDTLTHRGPNDSGIYISKHTCLGHRRLSIRDIKNGGQPMTRTLHGHTATIVFNGEIYNTDELKRILAPYRIQYSTTCDTEVIIYAYLAFGTALFKYFNGIFAFCIVDDDKIYIARDHLGVKPLFFYHNKQEFVFASEPKAIFEYGIKPEVTREGLCEIFGLGPAHTPGKGVFKGINELLPGHTIIISIYGEYLEVTDECFWSLEAKEHLDSYDATIDTVSFLITDSIRKQLVSDIPICSFLSGGLDSSLVTAICQTFMKTEDKCFHTFSFDFKDNNKNFVANSFQSSQDRPFVDIMVNHIGSEHHYLECTNELQYEYLFKAVDARDVPCMADVESSLLYFCSQVAQTHQVAMTGECADEIFGGYPWFHNKKFLDINGFPWSHDLGSRTVLLNNDFAEYLDINSYVTKAYEDSKALVPHLDDEKGDELKMREISWLNIMWFMQTLLSRMDRTSMYSGLETRVPFADYRILEYVYNIPWEIKAKDGIRKNLLIETGKYYLPPEVLYRKKSPYPKTYDPAYEKLLSSRLLEILESGDSKLSLLCDLDKVRGFVNSDKDYGKPWYGQLMAGPQMLAYMLQVSYWLSKYDLTI